MAVIQAENMPTRFSNKPESLQSSLGFYITQNTYIGEHGLSLRMKGLEPGYNDKALQTEYCNTWR